MDKKSKNRLIDFVKFAKGDPLLSAWEANFVGNMSLIVNEYNLDKISLSDKQEEIIKQISEKIGFGLDNPPDIVMVDIDQEYAKPYVEVEEKEAFLDDIFA